MDAHSIQRLIDLDGDFLELLRAAQVGSPDGGAGSRPPAVILAPADLDRVLELYENRSISAGQLREWAELMEMNDVLDYSSGSEGLVADVLFLLSTPEINGPVSADRVRRMRLLLRQSPPDE